MPRPRTHDDALRLRLLDRAGELLSTEGPDALSLRRLAADVSTSTTAVYSLFGGKPALLKALHEEAFRRFGARLATVPVTDDPVEDLVRIALAYRESALADPQFYGIMFSKIVPEFTPVVTHTFEPVIDAVRRAVDQGMFQAEQPEHIALSAWGIAHGLVSLELSGNMPPGVDAYESAMRAHADGWRNPGRRPPRNLPGLR